jgi:hypothetical protein
MRPRVTAIIDEASRLVQKAVRTTQRLHVRKRDERTIGSVNAPSIGVAAIRTLSVLVVVLGAVLVALSPRRRALIARKLEESRAFASRRVVDRDARDRSARDRWADDGGASNGGNNATFR